MSHQYSARHSINPIVIYHSLCYKTFCAARFPVYQRINYGISFYFQVKYILPYAKKGKRTNFTHLSHHAAWKFWQSCFIDDHRYLNFYKLLEHCCAQYGCKIYLFYLMTNHVHLVMHVTKRTVVYGRSHLGASSYAISNGMP